MPKLNETELKNLLVDYSNNLRVGEIADKYNLNVGSVRKILIKNLVYDKYKRQSKFLYNFESIDSEVFAYIYGYLWADGYINRRNQVIGLNLNPKDKYVIDLIHDKIGGKIYNYNRYDKRTNKNYPICIIKIGSKLSVDNILKLGFRNDITSIPVNLYKHFLRGFLDGDGCIYINKKLFMFQIIFSGKREETWQHIINLNIINKYKIKVNKTSSILLVEGTHTEKFEFLKYLYEGSNYYLKRKHDKIYEYFK